MALLWEVILSLLMASALAVPWNGPLNTEAPTPCTDQLQLASDAPAPTEAPKPLLRRDAISPQQCGYLWGVNSSPWMCDPFSTCLWRTDISVAGCCRDTTNLNTCSMYTTCVDYTDIGTASSTTLNSLVLQW